MRSALKLCALVTVVSAINLGMIVLVLSQLPVTLAGPADEPCLAGDNNGDGAVDLGDAIALLAYLFDDGPEPTACAQEVVVEVPVQTWPPRPQDMVHLVGIVEVEDANTSAVLFEVPDGRWLVLTDIHADRSGGDYELLQDTGDGTSVIRSQFSLDGVIVVRTNNSNGLGLTYAPQNASSVGIALEPGSDLVVSRGGGEGGSFFYDVTGYLVDDDR